LCDLQIQDNATNQSMDYFFLFYLPTMIVLIPLESTKKLSS
jgi:hypothetical protein